MIVEPKGDSLLEEAPLQRPGAHAQFLGNILHPRFLTGQKPLQDCFHLLFQTPIRKVLRQLCFQLRRHQLEKIRIVGYERLRQVFNAEE